MAFLARQNRVVVSGVGILAANGIGKSLFWKTLLAGQSGIGLITLFDSSNTPCKIAGEIKNFDPAKFIDRHMKPNRMGRFTQLALVATQMAIEDAGYDLENLRLIRNLPFVLGVSTSAVDVLEQHVRQIEKRGADGGMPYSTYAFMPHAAVSTITTCLGLNAYPVTVSTACAAGLDAVAMAYSMIRSGKADVAIAGGADAPITRTSFTSFAAAGLVSSRDQDPARASRPFDLDRDSGVISEGSGVVILENLTHALSRGVDPYIEITGYGMNTDSRADTPGCGLDETMQMALANAGRRAEDVDYVCAHGPGHPVLDRVETEMIKKTLGQRAYDVPVSSIKGVTGNPLAAAGPLQLVTCALAFRHGIVPPTANYEKMDPDCDLDYVTGKPRKAHLECALINSHGLGGRNCSLVVQRVMT